MKIDRQKYPVLAQIIVAAGRLEHVWTLKGNKRVYITHADGTDSYILHQGKDWVPYRSLTGAKKYLAKLLGKPYEKLEFIYTTEKI